MKIENVTSPLVTVNQNEWLRKPTEDEIVAEIADPQSGGEPEAATIVRLVELDMSEMDEFVADPLKRRPEWFAGVYDRIEYRASEGLRIVAVLDGFRELWIDTQGSEYARYVHVAWEGDRPELTPVEIVRTGRSPKGGLRNFGAMLTPKLKATRRAVVSENNDAEALRKIDAELARREAELEAERIVEIVETQGFSAGVAAVREAIEAAKQQ